LPAIAPLRRRALQVLVVVLGALAGYWFAREAIPAFDVPPGTVSVP
jgi:hypothetical protein